MATSGGNVINNLMTGQQQGANMNGSNQGASMTGSNNAVQTSPDQNMFGAQPQTITPDQNTTFTPTPTTPTQNIATSSSGSGPSTQGSDPFASSGGGTYFANLNAWVPNSNTAAIQSYTQQNGGAGASSNASSSSSAASAQPDNTAPQIPLAGNTTSAPVPTNLTAPTTGNSVNVSGVGTVANGALTSSDATGPTTNTDLAEQQALAASLPTASNYQDPGTPTVSDSTYSTSPAMQALLSQMSGITSQGLAVDPNDPVIKSQVDAYQAQQERAARTATNNAAASNSPYNTGQQANNARMIQEQEGQNVGQFQGQVMQNELTARRNEIQNILQTQGGLLSQDQQNSLQTELANMNSQLSQAGMKVQNTQFYQGLNQQDKQFVNQLTANEASQSMSDTLSRYTLYQQQSQFAAGLAQQGDFQNLSAALQQSGMNQQNQQFLMSLAQNGNIAQMQNEFQKMQLSQDQNQFVASLAQQGNLAQLQNVFQYAQLAQQGGEFNASIGQNEGQFLDTLQNNTGLEQALLQQQSSQGG